MDNISRVLVARGRGAVVGAAVSVWGVWGLGPVDVRGVLDGLGIRELEGLVTRELDPRTG